jgi:hypothetical protein
MSAPATAPETIMGGVPVAPPVIGKQPPMSDSEQMREQIRRAMMAQQGTQLQ